MRLSNRHIVLDIACAVLSPRSPPEALAHVLSTLGRDRDHATRGSRAVNRGSRRAFDDFDALDVVDVDAGESTTAGVGELVAQGHTINDVNRRSTRRIRRD